MVGNEMIGMGTVRKEVWEGDGREAETGGMCTKLGSKNCI